jgi:hypothetical protein
MININQNNCMSFKNKNSIIQCPFNKLPNSHFCGIHSRSLNPKKINDFSSKSNSDIYTYSDIINSNINEINFSKLKFTFKELGINSLFSLHNSNKKIYKKSLFNYLISYYQNMNYYRENINKIIFLQSFIRGYLVRKRNKFINQEDFFTMDSKYDIPYIYFFSIIDNGFPYCFDIRSFKKILEIDKPINPYTMEPISTETMNDFNNRINQLYKFNINLDIENTIVDPDQEFVHKIIDVFHNIDILEINTDFRWFQNLELNDLINL